MSAPPGQCHQLRAAHEYLQPVIEKPDPQPVADQARWHSVKDLAQGEPAGAGDGDDDLLEVRRAVRRQSLQIGSLRRDTLALGRIPTPDDLVDEGTISAKIGKFRAAPHQECVTDRRLEVPMGALDRTVLVCHAAVIARRRHPVTGTESLAAFGQVQLRVLVEIAEG